MDNKLKPLKNVCVFMGLTVVLQGCGNTQTDTDTPPLQLYQNPNSEEAKAAREFEQRPNIQYMFNNTFSAYFPSIEDFPNTEEVWIGNATAHYSGELSPSFKTTLVQLLDNLSNEGFQGFDKDISGRYGATSVGTPDYVGWKVSQPQPTYELSDNIIDYIIGVQPKEDGRDIAYARSLNYVLTLIGLTYKNQALMLVRSPDKKPKLVLANAFRKDSQVSSLPDINAETDAPVTDAQIAAWNQIFIDTLKKDPFFGANPDYIKDLSSQMAFNPYDEPSVDSTGLNINGVIGAKTELNLPLNVQLKGNLNTNNFNQRLLGKVTRFIGGGVNVGTVHAYEKTGLNAQNEHSISLGYNKNSLIIESQAGSVAKLNKNSNAQTVLGQRYQAIMGYSFGFLTPFVQAVHQNIQQFANTTTYLGLNIAHTHRINNTAALTVYMTAKLGMQSLDAFRFHESSLDVSVHFSPATDVWFATSLAINPLEVMLNMNFNVSY